MVSQMYFLLLLWLPASHGYIVRLPCFSTANFSFAREGFALMGYVIKSFEELSDEECQNECLHHPLCQSINLKDGGGINCQLNDKSAANPFDLDAKLSPSPGWTFRSTNFFERNIGPMCKAMRPCPFSKTCKPICSCPGYECVDSMPGTYASCADAYSSGFRKNMAYPIALVTAGVIVAPCDMATDGGGWIIFQRRVDNTIDFFRNWTDYRRGFGDLNGNFWLGLDKLHQLAAPGKKAILRVDIKHMGFSSMKFAKYTTFEIADESDDYRLTIGGYTGDAGASLNIHNRIKFSTKDRDNDNVKANCAQTYFGAWWYKQCHVSNLNGLYPPDNQRNPSYMSWKILTGSHGRVTFSEMKLKHEGHYASCADAYNQGFRQSRTYQIVLPNVAVIGVRCDMATDGGGWMVFQRRIDNTVDFFQKWADYKEGFGDLNGNFWLGLDKLHQLAGAGKKAILRVDLKHMDQTSPKFAKYKTFEIADESDDYRLTIGKYTGDAGDSLAFHNGMKFSTKDRENDKSGKKDCAKAYFGAWWYYNCLHSNLNGLYPSNNDKTPTYMSWQSLTSSFGRVTFSEMKLKYVV